MIGNYIIVSGVLALANVVGEFGYCVVGCFNIMICGGLEGRLLQRRVGTAVHLRG